MSEPYIDGHHPSCCGGCETCFSVCGGYHGRERRIGPEDRRVHNLDILVEDIIYMTIYELNNGNFPDHVDSHSHRRIQEYARKAMREKGQQ